ncbi:MAG: phosphohistidine phosphatase SixA [bacterium]
MELHVLRHGLAAERGAKGYDDDSLRPLTPAGRAKTLEVARGLKNLGFKWDIVWTSPFVRARQTAEIVAQAYGLPKKNLRETDALIPTASLKQLGEILSQFPNAAAQLIVGHEPHLSTMVGEIIGAGGAFNVDFKKAGLIIVELTRLSPLPAGILTAYLPPKVLRSFA